MDIRNQKETFIFTIGKVKKLLYIFLIASILLKNKGEFFNNYSKKNLLSRDITNLLLLFFLIKSIHLN